MHRTQVLLEERQYEALMARARREARGLSDLIRLAVDRLLGREKRSRNSSRLGSLRGIGSDPRGPSGRDHDRLLYGPPR